MAGRTPVPRSGNWKLTAAQARAIVRYNRRVFDRYVRRLRRLPLRRATKNRETGHLNWIATFSHIVNVHEAWMIYIVPGRLTELSARFKDDDRHPRSWRGLERYADLVFGGVEKWSRNVTPHELNRPVRAPWMPGHYTVSDALMQTTLEEAHHLGEIIGTLWQDDTAPPAMTWIELTRPRPRRA